jgi:ABC-type metal ion transport system substrate-binding protein
MALYSLDTGNRLQECREVLPVYLSKDWSECEKILKTIEEAGLITMTDGEVSLTHKIEAQHPIICGCG